MTLIVDDSIDVWGDDLPNLCLTRRFVGDKLDDGLQLLSWQITQAHQAFFEGAPSNGFSYDEPATGGIPRAPPSVHAVLAEQRGHLLAGCVIALTGVVADLSEESVERQPLCTLIRLYGGEVTLSIDAATHLCARRKDGWQRSPKIRRALERIQVSRRPCPAHPHTCCCCCCPATARLPLCSYTTLPQITRALAASPVMHNEPCVPVACYERPSPPDAARWFADRLCS